MDSLVVKSEELLVNGGFEVPVKMEKLGEGINSCTYKIRSKTQRTCILKSYKKGVTGKLERLRREWNFLQFASAACPEYVPHPIGCSEKDFTLLMSFEDGRKKSSKKVTKFETEKAADFICQLNNKKQSKSALKLGEASEACFKLSDHLKTARTRIKQLLKASETTPEHKEMKFFVKESLIPLCDKLYKYAERNPDYECSKIISPSDFGMHNALNRKNKLVFIDFEYAGWDGIGKLLSDFILQPQYICPIENTEIFLGKIRPIIRPSEQTKLKSYLPFMLTAQSIKWCGVRLKSFYKNTESKLFFDKKNEVRGELQSTLEITRKFINRMTGSLINEL